MMELANRKPASNCLPATAEPGAARTAADDSDAPTAAASSVADADARATAHHAARQASRLRAKGATKGVARNVAKKKPAARLRPCPKPLWPVKAPYPDAGAVLPFRRIVAYYGNYYSKQMGILGEYPPEEVLSRLRQVGTEWAAADPSTPVTLGLDYIVVSAQAAAGKDGMYRLRMPSSQIDKALQMADEVHGLLFLDVQPGWSSLAAELAQIEPYMKRPNVELALDPEFALVRGRRPGAWRGTMSAAQINYAVEWLANIVTANHLAPKVLIVHRFTEAMVTDSRDIRPRPQVQIVMDMDGFGSPTLKTDAYRHFIASQPVQFTGFKLFYKNDVKWGKRLMTPAQILALSPRPSYIVYQ